MSSSTFVVGLTQAQRASLPPELSHGAAPQRVSQESLAANSNDQRQRRSRISWKWVAVALAVAAVAIVYVAPWATWAGLSHHSVVDKPALRVVTIDRPAAAGASNVVLPATVRPWQTATLHARVSGYLAAWHHDLGEKVRAGELLAEIDTPELDQELAEAQGMSREASAAAVQAIAEKIEAEADLQVAEAQLVRVEAEVELAQAQFGRREQLLERRAISQEEHETFRRDLAVRQADVVAAQSDVARRRANLETRTAVIQVREAAANSRQANVERLQKLQGFKRIVAPFDGVIIRREAEVGMLVSAGQESLFVVEDMSRVRVQVHVPQAYSAQTRPGAEATIQLPESSQAGIVAKVTRIAESVDPTNRTMLAEIELDNVADHLQPGSYSQVTLQTAGNSAWTIATNALQMRVDGPHVAIVNEANEIEVQPVTLGRDLGTRVIAVAGIRGDERLVVNPGDDLVPGVRVQISQPQIAVRQVAGR